jgi:pimeloyl-ACP methyl ester carboxylesterase
MEGYRKPLRVKNWDRALWELARSSQPADLAPRLKEIRMSSLVITGDDDRIVPKEQSFRLAKEIPGAQLVIIASAGHVPHEEQPEAFMKAVVEFIHRVQRD